MVRTAANGWFKSHRSGAIIWTSARLRHSENALAWASTLAREFGVKLSGVHVQQKHESKDIAVQELEKLKTAIGTGTASLSTQQGDVAHEVSSFARSAVADLLIIGRGADHNGPGRLRTNAYAIIREAGCPVLSI